MNDLTVNDLLSAPQREFRAGVISLYRDALDDLGISIEGCTIQGEFADKGVFTELHKRLLLPDNYTIRGIFLQWYMRTWDVVVESPDLPPVEQGCEAPAITPIYEVCHEEYGTHLEKMTRLKEIRIEGRWQRMYSPGEITPENRGKL